MYTSPTIIKGKTFSDERGTLQFCNDLNLSKFQRFYTIKHNNCDFIRGWQGHKQESKVFYVTKGVFEINICPLENFGEAFEKNRVSTFVLSSKEQNFLWVPGGFATALRCVEEDSLLMVFSEFNVGKAAKDDFRFDLSTFPL